MKPEETKKGLSDTKPPPTQALLIMSLVSGSCLNSESNFNLCLTVSVYRLSTESLEGIGVVGFHRLQVEEQMDKERCGRDDHNSRSERSHPRSGHDRSRVAPILNLLVFKPQTHTQRNEHELEQNMKMDIEISTPQKS